MNLKLTADISHSGMRLDSFLSGSYEELSRSYIQKLIRSGAVFVNGKPAKASLNVKVGDVIEIQFGAKAVKAEVLNVLDTVMKDAAAELYRYL